RTSAPSMSDLRVPSRAGPTSRGATVRKSSSRSCSAMSWPTKEGLPSVSTVLKPSVLGVQAQFREADRSPVELDERLRNPVCGKTRILEEAFQWLIENSRPPEAHDA